MKVNFSLLYACTVSESSYIFILREHLENPCKSLTFDNRLKFVCRGDIFYQGPEFTPDQFESCMPKPLFLHKIRKNRTRLSNERMKCHASQNLNQQLNYLQQYLCYAFIISPVLQFLGSMVIVINGYLQLKPGALQ